MTKIRPSRPSHHHDCNGEVRGRNRGTPDDSIGRNRGTPDDSIGRNRGTPDDSIGRKGNRPSGGLEDMMGMFLPGKGQGRASLGRTQGRPTGKGELSPLAFGIGSFPNLDGKGGNKRAENGTNARPNLDPKALLARSSAKKVMSDPAFQALPTSERDALVNLMAKGGPKAADGLHQLLKDKRLDVLLHADSSGRTVLENLTRIAGSKQPQVAGDVLDDLATPKEVEQGYAPTCTATSMQYEMAKERPAEYARLMAGLVVDGHVKMSGGADLSIDVAKAISSSDARRDYRSDSEAVFQSAVMEYANGKARYDLDTQATVEGWKTYRGLFPDQIRDALGQLFGAKYETKQVLSDDMARAELAQLATRERPNRPVLFDIDMGSFNHNVSLERVTDKYVYYRDPATGDVTAMTHADFIKKLTSIHYPVD